ncbi:hypothetical protein [Pseudomonas sp. TUM22785]|uniref:hypothetical protein n=1 Tax=Pseudomonas sp. TUM22785 TaxID=3019098 RepID=UPI0023064018|nr:hypothetical protein [Pseudomonas sp. TUM22785]WCD80586.1 hypothetical protein PI990_00815 [Pseudomonas sp. TUM22785]
MRSTLALLIAAAALAGCSSAPSDPSGIWINQAAIDEAAKEGKLRESLLAYGPNLEWQIDAKAGTANYSNGFELGEGRLVSQGKANWRVDFYGDEFHEQLGLDGKELVQKSSENLPEQRFVHPAKPAAADAPEGSSFEYALYEAYLGGTWKILEGMGQGGLVLFHPDGSLEGLPGADRFALCLAGDCAAMSGENDSIWLQLGTQGSPWIFVHDGNRLEILEAGNRAQIDEMPEYAPGKRAWLLERQ